MINHISHCAWPMMVVNILIKPTVSDSTRLEKWPRGVKNARLIPVEHK